MYSFHFAAGRARIWLLLPIICLAGCCAPAARGDYLSPSDHLDPPSLKKPELQKTELPPIIEDDGTGPDKRYGRNDAGKQDLLTAEKGAETANEDQENKKLDDQKRLKTLNDQPLSGDKELPQKALKTSKRVVELSPSNRLMTPPQEKGDAGKRAGSYKLLRTIDEVALPQSVVFDKPSLKFFVSRMGDRSRTQSGAISLLERDGTLVRKSWVSGLDQPRGMAIAAGRLFVADGKTLVEIDIAAAKIQNRYLQDDVFYFNDVAVSDGGRVFVSAPLSNTIYELKDGELEVFLKSAELSGPNALAIMGDVLYVGSIGLETGESDGDDRGRIFEINLKSKRLKNFLLPSLASISSLGVDDNGGLFAAFEAGPQLLKIDIKRRALVERVDLSQMFKLKSRSGLGDFIYLAGSKEFWAPLKRNGHILVFGRSDAVLGETLKR